jgi:hypothetical protein
MHSTEAEPEFLLVSGFRLLGSEKSAFLVLVANDP